METTAAPATNGPVGVIVLAAGQGRRMGRLKQLLPLGDRRIVDWVVAAASGARIGPVVAVLHPAVAAAGVPRTPHPAVHPVVNPWPEDGQARSLRLGLRSLLQVEPALVAAVVMLGDQPFITPEVVRGLVQAFLAAPHGPAGPLAARPVWDGVPGHPVLLARGLFPEVLRLQGDAGAQPLLARHRSRVLHWPAPGPEVIRDLDTWADYAAACRSRTGSNRPPTRPDAPPTWAGPAAAGHSIADPPSPGAVPDGAPTPRNPRPGTGGRPGAGKEART